MKQHWPIKLLFEDAGYYEASVKWRESSLDLEYSYNDSLEIERPIQQAQLPENLKLKYQELSEIFDHILLEKVFRLGRNSGYEFYCFKNNKLTKYNFDG